MSLALPDQWIWDFWLVRDGSDHHLFFLQAPHDIGDPDLRHWNVSIGHAVSTDLAHWELLPDALRPGEEGSWDDWSTWTGSIVRHDGNWCLLYTGTSSREDGLVQRIGLARSDDLMSWQRHPGPVLEADPRWYETLEDRTWHDQAWRDPWIHRDTDTFHALITARSRTGAVRERGVIGHARSGDLVHWEVQPPLTGRLGFGQMEVPQLLPVEGRWYLLFSSDGETQSGRRRSGPGTGTYYLVADAPLGPFRMLGDGAIEADRAGSRYAGKLHELATSRMVFLSWHRTGADGDFHGILGDPRPVTVGADGALQLGAEASSGTEES